MRILIVLVLGLVLVLTGWLVWQKKAWDGQSRFTVVDLGSPLRVLSFDPSTGSGLILIIPDNLDIDSVGGHGVWRAAVLTKAGRPWGQKWAADSLADYLGITYTGILGKLPTWDKLVWWWWGKKVQWETVNLEETTQVTTFTDPDGLQLLRLTERWPIKAEEWFFAANLARESENVTIVNSTAVGGLGAHVARVIENAGLRVVAVNNTQNEIEKCILSGGLEAKNSLAGVWLQSVFGCDWQVKGERGDINLVVGREYQKWWNGD